MNHHIVDFDDGGALPIINKILPGDTMEITWKDIEYDQYLRLDTPDGSDEVKVYCKKRYLVVSVRKNARNQTILMLLGPGTPLKEFIL
jgi:hypothetical protein